MIQKAVRNDTKTASRDIIGLWRALNPLSTIERVVIGQNYQPMPQVVSREISYQVGRGYLATPSGDATIANSVT